MNQLLLHIFFTLTLTFNSLTADSFEYVSLEKDITKDFLISLKNDISKEESLPPETKENSIKILDEAIKNFEDFEKYESKLTKLKQELATAGEEITANESYLASLHEINLPEIKSLNLSQLIQKLINIEAEKNQKEIELEKILINITNRDEEIKKLIQKASELRRNISEIKTFIYSSPESINEPPIIAEVKKILQTTKIMSLEKELELTLFEVDSYETKSKLMNSRLERCRAEIKNAEDSIKLLREEIDNKKREEIEKTIKSSIDFLASLPNFNLNLIPEISALAEENIKLAKERQLFSNLYDESNQYKEAYSTYQQKLRNQKLQLESLKSKIEQKELVSTLRLNLKQLKFSLPKIKELREIKRNIESDLTEVENKYSELLLRKVELSDVEKRILSTYQKVSESISTTEKKKIKKNIEDIIKTQKDLFSTLISDYENYISLLTNTLSTVTNWIEHTNEFILFIDENMLWTRIPLPSKEEIKNDLFRLSQHFKKLPPLTNVIYSDPWNLLLTLILLVGISLLMFILYKRSEEKLLSLCSLLRAPLSFTISNFAGFTIYFFIRVSVLPVWLVGIAYLINRLFPTSAIIQFTFSSVLISITAILLFAIPLTILKQKEISLFLLNSTREEFAQIYKKLLILGIILTTATFLSSLSNQIWMETQSTLADLMFRLVQFLCLPLLNIFIISLLLNLRKTALNFSGETKNISIKYLLMRNLAVIILISFTIIFFILLLGYTYAVYELEKKIIYTTLAVTLFLFFHRLFEIFLNFYKWKISFNQSIQIQAKTKLQKDSGQNEETDKDALSTDNTYHPSILLTNVSRTISWLTLIVCAFLILYIWSDIFPALNYLRKVHLWESSANIVDVQTQPKPSNETTESTSTTSTKESVTLWDLVVATFIFSITLFLFKNLGFYLDYFILQKIEMGEGERYAIKTILEYLILIVGVVVSLNTLRVTWSKVQWLVAALGVGFGFGLQEIVANFVSGLILLFERPIRVGDIVTVGEISGRVKALRMRSTSIVSWENKELIVPNKEILSQKFVNWTRENPVVRLTIPVGVSYNSDINKVIEILDEIGKGHPFVEHEPTPKAYFVRFGSSALEFELRVYTKTSYYLDLQHELLCTIFNRFNQENIEIAYPQLDVHIKSNIKDSELPK
ncbi:MAG: mechanosensitive ion channel [Candidatus Hydrogenedentes bacterium]|nr:mechanosensitive ion channel [Candidatus Hydrogenedentota bacterium]